ncbi:MAG: T9SS type A sorting domain-containing protein [Bacteroidetes bacterium]|nr:T9SS type A sorting domain-containing protein [Bacteroidota bacterium]
MKTVLLITSFIVIISNSFGQTNVYHPFPDSNAVWLQSSWYIDGGACLISDDHNLFISGDTVIGSHTYHKLYKNGYKSSFCTPPFPPYYYFGEYWGAFRQDIINKKIYLFKYGQDTLAYNFNLNVGDTLPTSVINGFNFVDSIDSVLVGNHYNKRFWLSNGWYNNYAAIIEGIGSTYGAFAQLVVPFESGSNLWCVKMNNQTVWNYDTTNSCTLITKIDDIEEPTRTSVYPNPFSTSTIIKINKNLKEATLQVYNSLGQEIKRIQHIFGQEVKLERDNLAIGVYLLRLIEDNRIIMENKISITN